MRKLALIIAISLGLNLLVLSLGHSQTNMNVSGYVPETDLNRNTAKGQIIVQSEPEQNIYLFWFEKAIGLETAKNKDQGQAENNAQTSYDKIASSLILWILMVAAAIIFWFGLKFLDRISLRLARGQQALKSLKNKRKQ